MYKLEQKIISLASSFFERELCLDDGSESCESWDSLKHLEFIFFLENELKVRFSRGSIQSLKTLRQIANAVIEIKK